MRIGRTVAFVHTGTAMAPDADIKSIRLGQVVGILENGTVVGEVPEAETADGLNVRIDSAGYTEWVPRGKAHTIYTQRDTDGLNAAVQKLLGVPIGASVAEVKAPKQAVSFADNDPWVQNSIAAHDAEVLHEEGEYELHDTLPPYTADASYDDVELHEEEDEEAQDN